MIQYKQSLHRREKRRLYQQKYVQIHPERIKLRNDRYQPTRITFLGKRIGVGFNPRTGICSNCNRSIYKGEIKRTQMHHDKYDKSNPLAHTRELCIGCHNKEHGR